MATVSKNYDYGDVIITLENRILSREQIENTPSTRDGLDKEVEIDLRIVSCEYIQMAGILLKLPQVAMATAQVLFQRFYYSKSLIKHDAEIYAMASLFLAAKIEECPRRIRDVINVFHHIKQKRNGRTIQPMEYMGNHYFVLKNQVIKAERRILKELGFCVHVKHPHKIIIMYLQILECHTNQMLAQQAWNFMNDSFRTNIFVRYSPETIGCACIFLSARQLGICLPLRPPWWELFGAKLEDLEEISLTLLALYMRPKANLETLQKAVGELRKEVAQKKADSKTDTASNFTPNISPSGGSTAARPESRPGSRPASPSKISPPSAASGLDSKKKKSVSGKDEDKRASNRERPAARATRQSRSPVDERPHRRTRSRSHSRSRSRSRSYSISISPDSITRSESESSDESPEKRRVPDKGKRHRSPDRGKDNERRARQRRYDEDYNRKKLKSDGSVNAARREKARERSRSPLSRSRSRSRSPGREKVKRARVKYDQGRDVKRKEDRHRERNGVEYRSRDKGRDRGRHRR